VRPLFLLALLAGCGAATVRPSDDEALIPIEELFGNPTAADPKISPDGQWLAYLAARGDALNVAVRPLAGGPVRFLTDAERPVDEYHWSGDARSILYFQDRGGNEGYHLIQADVEGGRVRDLTPFEGVEAALVGLPAQAPGLAVITLNHRDPRLADAYRVDLASGALALAAENPGAVTSYLADPRGQVLVAMAIDDRGRYRLQHRPDEASPWRAVITYGVEDDVAPLAWTEQPGQIYARSNHGADLQRVVRIDLATGAEQVVAEDPAGRVDLDSALVDPATGALLAARFAEDQARWVTRDPQLRALLAAAPPDTSLSIVSWSRDRRRWTLGASSPTAPIRYLLADGAAITPLFASRPALDRRRLAPTEPIRLRARDGVALAGYLTRPRRGRPPYPTVLAVHGGPWSRDVWDYDSDRQLLADRGYAVLSVNFRGSTGYGKRFSALARKAFAGAMQDDLLDAVAWAVARRISDPRRVAIVGGSYGGYAALTALTATPERFACGVDYAGPVDLVTLIEAFPPSWGPVPRPPLVPVRRRPARPRGSRRPPAPLADRARRSDPRAAPDLPGRQRSAGVARAVRRDRARAPPPRRAGDLPAGRRRGPQLRHPRVVARGQPRDRAVPRALPGRPRRADDRPRDRGPARRAHGRSRSPCQRAGSGAWTMKILGSAAWKPNGA
jgi:dipeptidyl aminopeptidase/acylaminoacyl peptidase